MTKFSEMYGGRKAAPQERVAREEDEDAGGTDPNIYTGL
jgi:hypothetical protein